MPKSDEKQEEVTGAAGINVIGLYELNVFIIQATVMKVAGGEARQPRKKLEQLGTVMKVMGGGRGRLPSLPRLIRGSESQSREAGTGRNLVLHVSTW